MLRIIFHKAESRRGFPHSFSHFNVFPLYFFNIIAEKRRCMFEHAENNQSHLFLVITLQRWSKALKLLQAQKSLLRSCGMLLERIAHRTGTLQSNALANNIGRSSCAFAKSKDKRAEIRKLSGMRTHPGSISESFATSSFSSI